MSIYKEWKKEMGKRIRNVELENVPALLKRCPSCNNLSLEFDPKTGRVHCTKCGFEENIPVFKK